MIAYKVVINEDGKLYSYCSLGNAKIIYLTDGSIVKPNIENSLIFVFDNIVDARLFACYSNAEIWEVEIDQMIPIKEYLLLPTDKEVFWYWTPLEKMTKNDDVRGKKNLTIFPCNSFGCNSLVMIKKVL
jgi:hypothetical protein